MDYVRKLLNLLMTIFLFVVLLNSSMVNAAEQYFTPGEKRIFTDLPKPSEIKPPPPPGGSISQPRVLIQKSSQMRAPGAKKQTPIIVKQMQRLGYREVSDESMKFFYIDNAKAKFIPIDEVTKNISSPLAIILNQGGIYKTMTLAGAVASGHEKETGKWTQVTRYFSLADGRTLIFAEVDLKGGRVSVSVPEELVNDKVNGAPASMVTRKTTSGKFFTELTWFTENKVYSLHLSSRAVGVGIKNELVSLATSIQQP